MKRRARLQLLVHGWTVKAVALLSAMAAGVWLGATSVGAYDQRLDEALQALQKAAALVESSSAGVVSHQTQNTFDRHVEKALADIQDAMDHIVAAGTAADADSGSR